MDLNQESTPMKTNTQSSLPFSMKRAVEAQKQALSQHPLYTAVRTLADLRIFMERHVGCVLDFMSILKSIQRDLTCVNVPWVRPIDTASARLINEIVLGEECDEVEPGVFMSHFEWYLQAMEEIGANTGPIRRVETALMNGASPAKAIAQAGLPVETAQFMTHTFSMLNEPVYVRAAVFFHGREDVIPKMFLPLAEALEKTGTPCGTLVAYLRRHVEIDGGEHGPAAMTLLKRLFEDKVEREQIALQAAQQSLFAREMLWDRTHRALLEQAEAQSA